MRWYKVLPLILLVIMGIACGDDEPVTEEPTATAIPSPTPAPTVTNPPPPTSIPVPATATPLPTPTTAPLPTATQTQATAAPCDCSGNRYNCNAFATHAEAQDCFEYCLSKTGLDIHWLDGDSDGSACELLP